MPLFSCPAAPVPLPRLSPIVQSKGEGRHCDTPGAGSKNVLNSSPEGSYRNKWSRIIVSHRLGKLGKDDSPIAETAFVSSMSNVFVDDSKYASYVYRSACFLTSNDYDDMDSEPAL